MCCGCVLRSIKSYFQLVNATNDIVSNEQQISNSVSCENVSLNKFLTFRWFLFKNDFIWYLITYCFVKITYLSICIFQSYRYKQKHLITHTFLFKLTVNPSVSIYLQFHQNKTWDSARMQCGRLPRLLVTFQHSKLFKSFKYSTIKGMDEV